MSPRLGFTTGHQREMQLRRPTLDSCTPKVMVYRRPARKQLAWFRLAAEQGFAPRGRDGRLHEKESRGSMPGDECTDVVATSTRRQKGAVEKLHDPWMDMPRPGHLFKVPVALLHLLVQAQRPRVLFLDFLFEPWRPGGRFLQFLFEPQRPGGPFLQVLIEF